MASGRFFFREVVPFIAMVTYECSQVGLTTIFKAASLKGLDYHVFLVYTYAISTLFSIPLSFFFHRNTELPPIKLSFLLQMFAIGILGFTSQLIGFRGIEFASPTLNSAMRNIIPGCTFVLAILFGMEKLMIKKLSSQAKIIGTILSISGALVVVLYKGPTIITSLSPSTSLNSLFAPSTSQQSQWIIGGALLAIAYFIISIWYIFQAKVVNEYPAELILVLLYNISCTIISTPVCFILQSDLSAWKIKPDISLAAVIYSGIIGTSGTIVQTWGLHVKGPVYVAMFSPLSIAIAAFMGVIFLGDTLYLGSIIGTIIISFGFYIVMWSKTQEVSKILEGDSNQISPSTQRDPLLQGYDVVSPKEGIRDTNA